MLALSSTAGAQVWTPHKRTRAHAMSSTTGKTRKTTPHPVAKKKKKTARKKATAKKKSRHHRSDDDFTYTEEDYPAK